MSPSRQVRPGVLLIALTLVACSSNPSPSDQPERAEGELTDSLPPAGYGTLRQDDFTVAAQEGDVQVKVTPLAEWVIRLAAPDTYQRLHGLVASRMERITDVARNAGLREKPSIFLVSFFTIARQAEFTPTDVQILSQGIQYRPIGILPLTSGWGSEQLLQEQTQSALYLFRPGIEIDVAFTVEYGKGSTTAWSRILRSLEAERARVMSRAKS